MTLLRSTRRCAAAAMVSATAMVLIAGCGATISGTAVTGTAATGAAGSAPSATVAPDSVRTTTPGSEAPGPVAAPAETWTATVDAGPVGISSPDGSLSVELTAGSVCFVPVGVIGKCGSLYAHADATFVVFSPLGDKLLVVAGPKNAAVVYVFDTSTAAARTLEPQGIQDFGAASVPVGWNLSSAVWNVDGSAVLLVPRTTEMTGPVIEFELATGAVTEPVRLAAQLANSSPSLWTTRAGLAVVASSGVEADTLWWADFATGKVSVISTFDEPGGTLALSSADPAGQTVLVCPRRSDGLLGATVGVAVDGSQSVKVLSDSRSCAGTVFSADGKSLAMTAIFDGKYQLIVIDLVADQRVLTVPLRAPAPATPPYLTWLGSVIVANDSSNSWFSQSFVIHLSH